MLNLFPILLVSFGLVACKEICFDDLGCFTNLKPFGGIAQRPFALLPKSPAEIETRFSLFTNSKPFEAKIITSENFTEEFSPSEKNIFIIHGTLNNDNVQWIQNMRASLLKHNSANIITVDWSKGNG